MSTDYPSVLDTADGPTVVFRGKNLYSPTAPVTACRRRAAALTILDRTLVLVPSPLLGHGIAELLEKCGAGCRVFLVELNPQLARLAERHLPEAIVNDPRITLCSADRLEQLERCFPPQVRRTCERVVLVGLSAGLTLHRRDYTRLHDWLQDEIRRAWQNRITTIHMARLWFRNLFANLALLPVSRPIASLRVDKPTLVIGAGPSLEPLLPELRELRDRLFLIAVDTALPLLAAHRITVDAVVALEPQHANLGDFLCADRGTPLLLADLFSYPAAIRLFAPDNTLFFASRPLESHVIARLEALGLLPLQIPPLGSVGVAAVHLACTICGGAVAFSGLDFAYPDGKTHARGAPMLQRHLRTHYRLSGDRIYPACLARPRLSRPDKRGGICKTDMVLLSYAEQLRSLSAVNAHLYDLGTHGLPTGAVQLETLRDFLFRSEGARRVTRPTAVQTISVPAVKQALEEQLRTLDQLEEQIAGVGTPSGTAGDDTAGIEQRLDRLLRAADYLYAETKPPAVTDGVLLRKTLAAAHFYRIHIRRALKSLERLSPPRS